MKLILDDEFKTQVGRAWGYRLIVFEDDIYAELDLILEQAYIDIHGGDSNQKFIVEECFFENDESTEFKSRLVSKIINRPTFRNFLPSRITSAEEVLLDKSRRLSPVGHSFREHSPKAFVTSLHQLVFNVISH